MGGIQEPPGAAGDDDDLTRPGAFNPRWLLVGFGTAPLPLCEGAAPFLFQSFLPGGPGRLRRTARPGRVLPLPEGGAEPIQGPGAVAVLAAGLACGHDDAGGTVREPDGRLRLVLVLAARTTGPERLDGALG